MVLALLPPIRRLILVLCLGAVALTGCGDDDGSSPVADGSTETTAVPANLDPPDEGDDDEDGDDENAADESDDAAAGDLPDSCELLTAEEVEALIGSATPEGEDDVAIDGVAYSQCFWEDADGEELIGVGVVDTTARYDMHAENMPTQEDVAGLGDEAIAFPGISSETRGATGGRTISISVDGRTVVVSLRLLGETPVDTVVPLAEAVLSRMG